MSILMPEREAVAAGPLVHLDVAFADYDRHRPILDGRVRPKGLDISANTAPIGEFCTRPVYEDFDAAEMSFSWYVAARDRGEPVIALPIFPLRMAVWGYVFVQSDSDIARPSDLAGKRIGSQGYRYTVNLWLRGLFQEHYGFSPEQATWVTAESEGAGYVPPQGINVEVQAGVRPEDNLRNGIVDAIWCPSVPKEFREGQPWIRRMFPDAQAEMQRFVRSTGIMPITHVLVMKKELAEQQPWIAASLYDAFVEAQAVADEVYQTDPKLMSLLDSVFILEQQRAVYGSSPYAHGLDANRNIVDAFVRYAHNQGYISRRLAAEELFAAATL
jgi:4,5-dihydroxyphthalate decarboxylase